MTSSIPKQVTHLLYTKMKMQDLADMTDEELMFFYGNLYHWLQLTENRIEKLRVKQPTEEKNDRQM